MEMSASDKLWNCTVVVLGSIFDLKDAIPSWLNYNDSDDPRNSHDNSWALEYICSLYSTYLKASWFFNFLLEKYNLL